MENGFTTIKTRSFVAIMTGLEDARRGVNAVGMKLSLAMN